MVIDGKGYRLNVGIILANDCGNLFWAKRIGFDGWQFPQGGVDSGEAPVEAMYRELKEEIGLGPNDVLMLGLTKQWLRYKLPKPYRRYDNTQMVIGQKQIWFLLRLAAGESKVRLDLSESPEFDQWCWVDYWRPPREVIYFKRKVYYEALKELEPLLFHNDTP